MNAEENRQIMAKNIRYFQEQKGVSNRQICEVLGFKYTTFMDWIKGNSYPRIDKIEALAMYFDCEKSDLIEDRQNKSIENKDLTKSQLELIELVENIPAEKAPLVLRTIKALLTED